MPNCVFVFAIYVTEHVEAQYIMRLYEVILFYPNKCVLVSIALFFQVVSRTEWMKYEVSTDSKLFLAWTANVPPPASCCPHENKKLLLFWAGNWRNLAAFGTARLVKTSDGRQRRRPRMVLAVRARSRFHHHGTPA